MSDLVGYLFGAASYVPHGYCLLWRPDLVAVHVVADLLTAAAYFSIPAAIVTFVRRRRDLEYRWLAGLFALFITACGTVHVVDAITLWQPVYGLQGLVKLATGLVSALTALVVWRILPDAMALPAPADLRRRNAALAAEVGRRRAAEAGLRDARDELERRVRLRTRDLEEANAALRRSQEHLAHLAMHDGLTGLPNRTLFHNLLREERERVARLGGRFALLLADLDRFKQVNDRFGHGAGDLLLTRVAGRLAGAVRASDTVARLGGDEFAIIARRVDDDEALAALAARVIAAIEAPCDLDGRQVSVGISLGAAVYPDDGDLDVLLRHADVALYEAKARQAGQVLRFSPALRQAWRPRADGNVRLAGA